MRRFLSLLLCSATLLAVLPAHAAKTRTSSRKTSAKASAGHSGATLHRTSSSRSARSKASAHAKNPHGHLSQISMDTERATQIQQALIRSGYLTGEPTGKWDAASISAMQKLQSDNGWQTKIMPDSRALIKLGLGPGPENSLTASSGSAPSVTPAMQP